MTETLNLEGLSFLVQRAYGYYKLNSTPVILNSQFSKVWGEGVCMERIFGSQVDVVWRLGRRRDGTVGNLGHSEI